MYGDRNTKFFHGSTIIRRRKKHVRLLINEMGDTISDPDQLETMATNFYKVLYSKEEDYIPLCLDGCFPRISKDDFSMLGDVVKDEEIRCAVFGIGAYKAPGKDGIQSLFYQSQWNTVGAKLCELVKSVFSKPSLVGELNDTLITLIPKVDDALSLKQFRPIILCNVSYKVITKILANRMRKVMNDLIGQY